MMYPTVSIDEVRRVSALKLDEVDIDLAVKWEGSGNELDLEPFNELSTALSKIIDESTKKKDKLKASSTERDAAEGKASVHLYKAVEDLDVSILDDPGFWRYLAISPLWEFTVWREPAFRAPERSWDSYRVYLDGRRNSECVPTRMYLRARIAESDGDFSLAQEIPDATDLWRSHIVRVNTSYSKPLATALLNAKKSDKDLKTDPLRELAKRIRRLGSNVVVHNYDEATAEAVIDELKPS